jgi:Domain of unknown function (DUF5642)
MVIADSLPRTAVALLLAAGLAGCGSGDKSATSTQSASSSTTTTAEAPGGFDISRIDQLVSQFPPDSGVTPIPHTKLNQQEADTLAGMRKEFVYDPPQCGSLLSKSTHLSEGSQIQGITAHKPEQIVVLAVESPQAVVDPPEIAGCDRVTFTVPDEVKGTAERIPGPTIPGIKTSGTKTHMDLTTPEGPKTVDETTFRAELSGRVEVAVGGKADPARLEDLLNKAVAALRGR